MDKLRIAGHSNGNESRRVHILKTAVAFMLAASLCLTLSACSSSKSSSSSSSATATSSSSQSASSEADVEIPVSGKYYCPHYVNGMEACVEFKDNQFRVSTEANTGVWRDYERKGNQLRMIGTDPDGTKSAMPGEVISETEIKLPAMEGSSRWATFTKR